MPKFNLYDHEITAPELKAGLYLVATPIGHLADITLRALLTLAGANTIVAEDKRVSKVLLDHYGITTPLCTYHDHNGAMMRPKLLARLQAGESLALISDAGTPLVSDPGYKLVVEAIAAGIMVTNVPGASAMLSALVLSGLPMDRFFFEGFLPAKKQERRERLMLLSSIPAALVFYESPHRVAESLQDLAEIFPDRSGVIARELTKKFEEVRRDSLVMLAQTLQDPAIPALRGEIVVVVAPPDEEQTRKKSEESLEATLLEALRHHSLKDAVQMVAGSLHLPKKQVYARALVLSTQE